MEIATIAFCPTFGTSFSSGADFESGCRIVYIPDVQVSRALGRPAVALSQLQALSQSRGHGPALMQAHDLEGSPST